MSKKCNYILLVATMLLSSCITINIGGDASVKSTTPTIAPVVAPHVETAPATTVSGDAVASAADSIHAAKPALDTVYVDVGPVYVVTAPVAVAPSPSPAVTDSVTEKTDTVLTEVVPVDIVQADSLDNVTQKKKSRRKTYAEERGMIRRDAMKTVFIPKGQWMLGVQVAWNQWNNDNLNYLILKDINFEGYTFSAGPYLGYFFRDNLAVGTRFSYKRYYFNMAELDLNLGEDLNISLKDLYYLQHNYKTTAFLRYYMPIGRSKIFGLFGELQLNYTYSEGRNTTGSKETLTAVYESCNEMELGLAGGAVVFLTDYLSSEIMLNVGGYHVKWGDQNTNNIEHGKVSNSGANFRINLFSIKFGVTYYL